MFNYILCLGQTRIIPKVLKIYQIEARRGRCHMCDYLPRMILRIISTDKRGSEISHLILSYIKIAVPKCIPPLEVVYTWESLT